MITRNDAMEKPLISIIVPVYGVERELPRCIDSIISQDFTDFELLLIDDGSPDRCGEICDEYAAKYSRIKVFHKPNGGVSSARNVGLDNAKGEWVMFVDSDDVLLQGALSISNSCIKAGWRNLISFRLKRNGKNSDRLLGDCHISVRELIMRHLTYNSIDPGPCAKLYENRKIGKVRFRTDLKIAEDLLFNIEYLIGLNDEQGQVYFSGNYVYDYITRAGSATQSDGLADEYAKINALSIPILTEKLSDDYSEYLAVYEASHLFWQFIQKKQMPTSDQDCRMRYLCSKINGISSHSDAKFLLYINLRKKNEFLAKCMLRFCIYASKIKRSLLRK